MIQKKEYKKTSKIKEGVVELKNASDSARLYFRKHKTGKINNDLVNHGSVYR